VGISIIGPGSNLKNGHKSKDIEDFKRILSFKLHFYEQYANYITQNDRINIHPKNISVTRVDRIEQDIFTIHYFALRVV